MLADTSRTIVDDTREGAYGRGSSPARHFDVFEQAGLAGLLGSRNVVLVPASAQRPRNAREAIGIYASTRCAVYFEDRVPATFV